MFDGLSARNNSRHPDWSLAVVDDFLGLASRYYGWAFLLKPERKRNNEEGVSGDRYSCFLDHITWRDYVTAAGLLQVRHCYRPPRLPRHKQWWLATVWRKG